MSSVVREGCFPFVRRFTRHGRSLFAELSLLILLAMLFSGHHVDCCHADDTIQFEEQILPIFADNCFHCHGEDEQQSGLRLDRRARMLRGGDSGLAALVPGDPENSYLLEVAQHLDPGMEMPPDGERLSDTAIEQLRMWIQQGAPWPGQMDDDVAATETDHWSFQPIVRPSVPDVRKGRTPIDRFLLHRLAQDGLSYSAPASPRTLQRRLSFVLTGLPPTTLETRHFLDATKQDADAAYAEEVDRLLASPHFGERWAQHWLDVIRWAETNGSEANLYRKNAWMYRDYVVSAFNEDLPYDEFVRQQIAGDSLGAGIATGFLVSGPHVPAATVGRVPSAIRQARADRMDEIMQTVGASILGVTVGCARCHNHKFDPITIRDYYSLTGVFQDVEFGSRLPEYGPDHPVSLATERLNADLEKQRQQMADFGAWEEDWRAYRELHFRPVTTRSIRLQFTMPNVGMDELEVFGPEDPQENFAAARLGTSVTSSHPDGSDGRKPIAYVIDGEYGTMRWAAKVDKDTAQKPWIELTFDRPLRIDRIRISSNREYFYGTDYLTQKNYLPPYRYDLTYRKQDGQWQAAAKVRDVHFQKNNDRDAIALALQQTIDAIGTQGAQPSFVGRFVHPDSTRVLLRGSPENPRDKVVAAGPAVLDGDLGLTAESPGAERRLKFAQWVSDANNPLTPRVIVNRIWQHVFGTGIVTTSGDFGSAGAAPSHPKLLDWLAAEFMDPQDSKKGNNVPWSMKQMIRQLVSTDAFRQSSAPNAMAQKIDTTTALLWRFPPRRMEAEVIRDSILSASGCLDDRVGGRGYRIHNVKKTYAQWEVLDNHGPKTWRRMLYQERMRRVDDQMFTAFDFPDCGTTRARRPVSTTPLQALNLLNSEFVIDQSKRIAQRAIDQSADDPGAQVTQCFLWLLGRSPDEDELKQCKALAAAGNLPLVARAIINTNEFAFLP